MRERRRGVGWRLGVAVEQERTLAGVGADGAAVEVGRCGPSPRPFLACDFTVGGAREIW